MKVLSNMTEAENKLSSQSQDQNSDVYDVTIIGGGPVGLFGAFYAGMRQMKTKIIDSLPELGGQLNALYPEKFVFDMPGFPKVLGRELASNLIEQGTRFDPAVCLSEMAVNLGYNADNNIVIHTQKQMHVTKTLIIATGAGAFSPKKLNIPGVSELEGKGIFYFVRNKARFAGKRLLIVGGGDSALDWAMNLEPIAEKITLIHRRDKFRCHEESLDWLFNRSKVETILWHELAEVRGEGCVQSAVIFDNRTNEQTVLDVDAVLLNIGFSADLGPIKQWGVKLIGNSIPVNTTMQVQDTEGNWMPGIYAAGDIATFEGKLKLIATGVGEICTAVCHAKTVVDPSAKLFPGHSSNMDL